MKNYYVYGHYKPGDVRPFYIGKGSSKRAWSKRSRTKYWNNVVSKYGYGVELMYINLTEEQALCTEKAMIKMYGRLDLGTGCLINLSDGGDSPLHSAITKSKISKSHKGLHHTEDTKLKISNTRKQRKIPSPTLGKQRSEDTKEKIRNKALGRKMPQHVLEKQRKRARGKGNPQYGKRWYNDGIYNFVLHLNDARIKYLIRGRIGKHRGPNKPHNTAP